MAPNQRTLKEIYEIMDSIIPDKNGCCPWIGSRKGASNYYQRVKVEGKQMYVHRISLERKLGRPIRAGFQAQHTCDYKPCINSEHLYEGTQAQNIEDILKRGRLNLEWANSPKNLANIRSPERQAKLDEWRRNRYSYWDKVKIE